MADNGYTSTDPTVQARIAEMQRQAEASAAAQRAQAAGQSYNAADIDPSQNASEIAAHNYWNSVAASRQANTEQAAGIDSSVGAGAYTRYGGGNYYSGSSGGSTPSTGSTTAATTTAGSGNTQTAITTPSATSTNTSAVASASGSYGDTSTGRPVIEDIYSYYSSLLEKPRSITEIRQEQINNAQQTIDATRAIYDEARQRRETMGKRQLAQTSAQNVGAGLAGSPFAQTNETGVTENTEYELNALAAQRTADISKIMADAETTAQNLYQQGLNNFYNERNFNVSERDKAIAEYKEQRAAVRTAAINSITTIAKSGYSIDEMDPIEYKTLLANSGMSDFEARAVWAASSPAANVQYSVQNGYLVGTYFDPHTGKPVVTTTALPQQLTESGYTPDVKSVTLADGSVIFYDGNSPYGEDGRLQTIDYAGSSIAKQTGGLSDPQKASIFNSIVGKYNASPLIMASDRLPVLEEAIRAIQENPEDAALQLNLSYAYIQALDTYQSAVREGELANLNSIDSKIGSLQNSIGQIQNGQIVRPEVAQQIAQAALGIVTTIQSAAAQKAQSFASQANVAGVGDEWSQYLGGFTPNYQSSYSSDTQNTPDNSGIVFNQSYATPDAIAQAYPELQDDISSLLNAGYSDAEIAQYFNGKYGAGGQSFNNDQSMSLNYSEQDIKNLNGIKKVAATYQPGAKGGQCGRFVNKLTGFRVGDSYASKMAITDPKIGRKNNPPKPGDVFVFPYKSTGHIGFIESVQPLADGTYKLGVIDSNYHLNEKVDRHFINSKIVTGYARPSKIMA